MSPKQIYIDATPISEQKISGIGHMTLELIRAMAKHPGVNKDFELNLVISYNKVKNLEVWRLQNVRYKKIWIPMRAFNILWKFDLIPFIDLLIGKGTYIFTNYRNWSLLRSKSLTFVCDVSYITHPDMVSPKNQQFLEKNIQKWVKRANRVLVISNDARQDIEKYLKVPETKLGYVPCGVDTSVFHRQDDSAIKAIKKQCNIEGEYILYLGNIEPRKNLARLIEAYKQLPSKQKAQYALVLIGGGGWLNEQIIASIQQAQEDGFNIIHPEFYIDEDMLPAIISGATLLAHPAIYEGFGISPLQAMACEVPVVTASISSLPEVVGDAALLVDPYDVGDISAKIALALDKPALRHELITKGLKRVKQYDWSKSADILVEESLNA